MTDGAGVPPPDGTGVAPLDGAKVSPMPLDDVEAAEGETVVSTPIGLGVYSELVVEVLPSSASKSCGRHIRLVSRKIMEEGRREGQTQSVENHHDCCRSQLAAPSYIYPRYYTSTSTRAKIIQREFGIHLWHGYFSVMSHDSFVLLVPRRGDFAPVAND